MIPKRKELRTCSKSTNTTSVTHSVERESCISVSSVQYEKTKQNMSGSAVELEYLKWYISNEIVTYGAHYYPRNCWKQIAQELHTNTHAWEIHTFGCTRLRIDRVRNMFGDTLIDRISWLMWNGNLSIVHLWYFGSDRTFPFIENGIHIINWIIAQMSFMEWVLDSISDFGFRSIAWDFHNAHTSTNILIL